MKYVVGSGVIGPECYLIISADEFEQIKRARTGILVLIDIEEKFKMLIDNYLEYEQALLSLALGYMALLSTDTRDAKALMNRKLANLLTISRLYTDQVKHDISMVCGNEKAKEVHLAFSVQYDRLLGYRFMEAIRNHLQHKSLPIQGFMFNSALDDHQNASALCYRTAAMANVEDLREKDFKPKILEELEKTCSFVGESKAFDITPFVRDHVEGFSRVQSQIREITIKEIPEWKAVLEDMLQRYHRHCGGEVKRAVMYRLNEDGEIEEQVWLLTTSAELLECLRKGYLPHSLSRCYVSA